MAEEVKLWQVEGGTRLLEIIRSKLDFEMRLENWIIENISLLSVDLLIIGTQVATDHGKYIDLLCMDDKGDLVIVELKKDKTPREVTAQVLDYASWVKELSPDRVVSLANEYFEKKNLNLGIAFQQKLKKELPEIINESHRMLIVSSEIDDSTERIIRYLSDSSIKINVAKFQYFKSSENQEFLARFFLIEQSEAVNPPPATKRRKNLTAQQLEAIADDNSVGDLYRCLVNGIDGKFITATSLTMLNFRGNIGGSSKAILNLVPGESSTTRGIYFQLYVKRCAEYSGLTEEFIVSLLPDNSKPWKYFESADEDFSGFAGFFKDEEEVEKFVAGIHNVVKH